MRHRKERKEGEKEKRRKGQKEVGRKTILETKLKYLSILFYLQKTHFIRFSSQDCPSLEKTMGVSERLYGWLPCSSPQHLLAAARRTEQECTAGAFLLQPAWFLLIDQFSRQLTYGREHIKLCWSATGLRYCNYYIWGPTKLSCAQQMLSASLNPGC